jgi:hypothetical protein
MTYTKVNKESSTYTKVQKEEGQENIEMSWDILRDTTWLDIANKTWKDWIIGLTSIYTKINKVLSNYEKVKH